eukprot:CAMPEP_0198737116 /NCGR_PEP_ID=MMETSP1475-20131203/67702_1 /TAXON_ID= ORGANISM="Unidentified sp., Strain CCMP1999" /NCGR_SAMPLE_ID=MMETSP1475 /ASSEMBLY_ACC=CAM_ASM_001111 /LENGTH=99 /DNA_ID=CAMNT_0044500973 /DNA_START=155 /DNA_END=454 /DNA_ORIENTATION=+
MAKLIDDHDVIVFSKSYCPHSRAAKDLLKDQSVKAEIVELDQEKDGADMQNYIREEFDHHTVPAVFFHGELIGGNSDLQDMHKDEGIQDVLDSYAKGDL